MKNKIDLTIVITTHDEGILAHKTMRSVLEAAEKVKEAGYTFEIIVHIDNGDAATIKYFERYKDQKGIEIYKNSFGDTAPSRNYVLSVAHGEYTAFLDGDDLISDNWYLSALNMLKKTKDDIIIHPEAVLTFGVDQPNVLTLQGDSCDQDPLILLGENRWGSVLVAKTKLLKDNLYRILSDGYGHEDYVFNINTLEKGIKHKVAPGTVLFYRRSEFSRLSFGNLHNVTIPYAKMFEFENIRKMSVDNKIKKKYTAKERAYKVYKSIRNNNTLNYFITPVAKLTLKVIKRNKGNSGINNKIPPFVLREWKKINHIETLLYPYDGSVKNIQMYDAREFLSVGRAYYKIAQNIRFKPDYVFLVPWVVRGGADKVLFNYIKALKEIHPEWHFTVIATIAEKNTWVSELPDYVDFVDFGKIALPLVPDMQDKLMTRLITQLDCVNLHIINSEYSYMWAKRHEELIRKRYNLYVSLFAWEYIRNSNLGGIFGYDNPRLFEIINAVKKVFTDNAAMVKYVIEEHAFDENKFKVHYQPVDSLDLRPPKDGVNEKGRLKILWAGRVAAVKMPELVAEIGRRLNSKKVTIDVFGEINKDTDSNVFRDIPAINYRGVYDGFSKLPTNEYDMLLYTSLTDGMPNVILEAAAAGLPIIASNDGGVGELIQNGRTGILIEDYLNSDAYVKAIEEVIANPEKLPEYAKNAQKLLLERHSWAEFVKNVKKDIN